MAKPVVRNVTPIVRAQPVNQPSKTTQPPAMGPVKAGTRGIIEAMLDEMNLIREGKSTPSRANAMAKAGTVIIAALEAEMKYEVHRSKFIVPEGGAEGVDFGVAENNDD